MRSSLNMMRRARIYGCAGEEAPPRLRPTRPKQSGWTHRTRFISQAITRARQRLMVCRFLTQAPVERIFSWLNIIAPASFNGFTMLEDLTRIKDMLLA